VCPLLKQKNNCRELGLLKKKQRAKHNSHLGGGSMYLQAIAIFLAITAITSFVLLKPYWIIYLLFALGIGFIVMFGVVKFQQGESCHRNLGDGDGEVKPATAQPSVLTPVTSTLTTLPVDATPMVTETGPHQPTQLVVQPLRDPVQTTPAVLSDQGDSRMLLADYEEPFTTALDHQLSGADQFSLNRTPTAQAMLGLAQRGNMFSDRKIMELNTARRTRASNPLLINNAPGLHDRNRGRLLYLEDEQDMYDAMNKQRLVPYAGVTGRHHAFAHG
jgi:hypothetical protein